MEANLLLYLKPNSIQYIVKVYKKLILLEALKRNLILKYIKPSKLQTLSEPLNRYLRKATFFRG